MAKAELSSTTLSIQALYRMFRDGEFYVDRRYQRKLVWSLEEKQRLIDSVLNELPIPLILLSKRSGEAGGSYDIIDGLQRIHTLMSYIENAFSTADGKYFDVKQLPRAAQAAHDDGFNTITDPGKLLPPDLCALYSEYILPVTTAEHADNTTIIEIFERINSYGRRLSEQEQRQAGLTSNFSQLVRQLSCEIRGDASEAHVPLQVMPEISVQGVRTTHGYGISAETTFWSKQGILHFTSLRDSLDEQIIADILACILNKSPIQRSKQALDGIYDPLSKEYRKFEDLLAQYGENDLKRDFLAVFDRIQQTCDALGEKNLQSTISGGAHHNEISTIFAAMFLAYFDLIIRRAMEPIDHAKVAKALEHLQITTQRKAIEPIIRTSNINSIKGAIQDYFAQADVQEFHLGKPLIFTFENSLRRAKIELPHYEFKQGFLLLAKDRAFQNDTVQDVINTMCAMANVEPNRDSFIYIGIADKPEDVVRIIKLDEITPISFEGRSVVGIKREANHVKMPLDRYVMKIKDLISTSALSDPLKADALSKLDCFSYHGMDVLRIVVPGQKSLSFVGNECFLRQGSSTVKISVQQIPQVGRHFV